MTLRNKEVRIPTRNYKGYLVCSKFAKDMHFTKLSLQRGCWAHMNQVKVSDQLQGGEELWLSIKAKVETVRAKEILVPSNCGTEAVTKVKAKRQFLEEPRQKPNQRITARKAMSIYLILELSRKRNDIQWQSDSLLTNGLNLETQMQD